MRNRDKYVYFTVGVLRNSITHMALLADAEKRHTKQIPTVITSWLNERAEGKSLPVSLPFTEKKDQGETGEAHRALSNAAEADDAWPD